MTPEELQERAAEMREFLGKKLDAFLEDEDRDPEDTAVFIDIESLCGPEGDEYDEDEDDEDSDEVMELYEVLAECSDKFEIEEEGGGFYVSRKDGPKIVYEAPAETSKDDFQIETETLRLAIEEAVIGILERSGDTIISEVSGVAIEATVLPVDTFRVVHDDGKERPCGGVSVCLRDGNDGASREFIIAIMARE